jgi:hypothetical protein
MILFGGEDPLLGYQGLNDVWVLTNADGKTGAPTWLQLTVSGPAPLARTNHIAVYDPNTNRLIVNGGDESLNGGGGCPCNIYNDTWVLTNANGTGSQPPAWSQLSPTGTIPTLDTAAFAYDPAQNKLFVFGGYDKGANTNGLGGATPSTATWVLSNANGLGGTPAWTQLATIGAPQDSIAATAGYDSATQRFFIFGGAMAPAEAQVTNSVYVLTNATGNGTSVWQPINVSGTPPLPRRAASGAYDAAHNEFLIFGGDEGAAAFLSLNDSWVLTNANGIVGSQLGITQLLPNRGGNAGSVSVRVFGSGFQNGATITLTGTGTDIPGLGVAVLNSSSLTATFALNGATLGARNLIVTNPDGTSASLLSGFTVEPGGAPQLAIDIIGRDKIRFGEAQTYYAFIRNLGTVDAVNVAGVVSQSYPLASAASSASVLAVLPSPSTFFGPVPALSPVLFPFTAIGPPSGSATNCPLITGSVHMIQANDPCAVFEAGKAAAEAYLNFLYASRLLNLLALSSSIEFRLCFNPLNPSTSGACNAQEAIDSNLDSAIKSAESNEQGLCALASAAGCPLNCNDPSDINYLKGVGDGLGSTIGQLKKIFLLPQIPLDQLQTLDSQVALFQTQALALPGSLTFPSQPQPQPPTALPTGTSSSLQACGAGSIDPNSKIGATGIGTERFVPGGIEMPYVISFENALSATAPAQTVVVTDQLDPSLDLTTVALGPITLPSGVIALPPTSSLATPLAVTVDLRPAENLLVQVNGSLNASTGLLTWTFQSLDPATNNPPADPLAGFLPPGAGGSVLLTAIPKSTAATGTLIQNTANVVFDLNPPISTPTWANTVDNTPPGSRIGALPSIETSLNFPVQWTGTDVGAGIQDFTVNVSDNGGPFTAFQSNTTATSATFSGQAGHTYAFYSIARDFVGNVEPAKTIAEATTQTGLAFATLTARAEITTRSRPGFELSGQLTLGPGSIGLAPDTQPVSLVLGNYSATIPAGSFKKNKKGVYAFEGKINGVGLEFRIVPVGRTSYTFSVEASGANLAGTTNPVTLELLIGGNGGVTQVNAEIH